MAWQYLPTIQTTSTNETRNPWAPASGALNQALSGAMNAYNTTYQGPQVAEMDPNVTSGQNAQLGIANRGSMSNAAQTGIGGIQNILNSGGIGAPTQQALGYLNPYASGAYINNNPYLDKIIQGAIGDATTNANAQFSKAGRYGSGTHISQLAGDAADISADYRYRDYLQQQGNQLNAINQMAGIGQQGVANIYNAGGALNNLQTPLYSDAQTQKGVGAERMDYRQAQIDAANQAPWARVGNLAQIAQGIGSMGGTSSGTSTSVGISPQQYTPTPSAGQMIAGGVLGGAGLAANMYSGGGFKNLFGSPFPNSYAKSMYPG